ncbi:MAG: thiamine pyrophosphate-binding protein [Gammaproteobacteria bacterium]|nr:thiamine pyrophosphate-binding protein [Gammaproteobacteria bacterium]MYD77165.1 thiamine pyrophosphate-binding protein [Gammaproteobacteria bacterium]
MTTISGGEAVYRVLCEQNVKTVFGLLGGSMLELYDALYLGKKISYVGARDERSAGHMADAYARITGGPGVVLGAQAGPGVVNLATAVAEAHLAYSPLVVIAGAVSRQDLGRDTFQEIDQVALFAPISKRSIAVFEPSGLTAAVRDAIRTALSGRPGPVVLHVPRDLFRADVEPASPEPVRIARAGPPAPEDIASIIALLGKACRPVILAGGGFKPGPASRALVRLAETTGIPVVTSTGHADIMPHDHALNAGQTGPRGNRVAGRLTREADLILAVGTRLGFNSTFFSNQYVSPSADIVHIDIEASAAGRYFPASLCIQADARESARALASQIEQHGPDSAEWAAWSESFLREREELLEERSAESENAAIPLHPTRAFGEIRDALPRDAIVTLDTGNACLAAADRLAHFNSPGLITPLDFGLVGFGYAAALGARAAAPDRPVVSIIGDGGFGYTMAEITTAVRHRLPVVAIVLDNGAWGAEKAYQQNFFDGRLIGSEIDSPPFDEVASLCGAKGYAVDRPGQLGATLAEALESGEPAVIHVKIDPAALSPLRRDLFRSASGAGPAEGDR